MAKNYNLTSQQIKDTFEQLGQVSGSIEGGVSGYALLDGTGSRVNVLHLTASNATLAATASFFDGSATSASYVESSNVDGPLGMNSILSSSFAITASYAENVDPIDTGSLLTTASFDNGTRDMTFTKGDGSTFTTNIPDATVATGSLLLTSSVVNDTITFTKGDGSTYTNVINNVSSSLSTQEIFVTAKNVQGVSIPKGYAVHSAGVTGENVNITTASYLDSSLMPAIGITQTAINAGAVGEVIISGRLKNVNTSNLVAGNPVYVNGEGALTATKPTGSALIQNIGVCAKVNATEGEIIVMGAGRSNDVPNIAPGYAWVGNSDSVATAVTTSSLLVDSASFATNSTSASHALNADTALTANTASYVAGANVDGTVASATSATSATRTDAVKRPTSSTNAVHKITLWDNAQESSGYFYQLAESGFGGQDFTYNPGTNRMTVGGIDVSGSATNSIYLTGDLTGSGIISSSGGFVGDLTGTASYATFAETTSGTITNAATASYVDPLVQDVHVTGSINLTGSMTVTGAGTAAINNQLLDSNFTIKSSPNNMFGTATRRDNINLSGDSTLFRAYSSWWLGVNINEYIQGLNDINLAGFNSYQNSIQSRMFDSTGTLGLWDITSPLAKYQVIYSSGSRAFQDYGGFGLFTYPPGYTPPNTSNDFNAAATLSKQPGEGWNNLNFRGNYLNFGGEHGGVIQIGNSSGFANRRTQNIGMAGDVLNFYATETKLLRSDMSGAKTNNTASIEIGNSGSEGRDFQTLDLSPNSGTNLHIELSSTTAQGIYNQVGTFGRKQVYARNFTLKLYGGTPGNTVTWGDEFSFPENKGWENVPQSGESTYMFEIYTGSLGGVRCINAIKNYQNYNPSTTYYELVDSASLALTASSVETLNQDVIVTGSVGVDGALTTTGAITAQGAIDVGSTSNPVQFPNNRLYFDTTTFGSGYAAFQLIDQGSTVDSQFEVTTFSGLDGSNPVARLRMGSNRNGDNTVIWSGVTDNYAHFKKQMVFDAPATASAEFSASAGIITDSITGDVNLNGSLVVTGSVRGNVTALSIASQTASIDTSLGDYYTLTLVSGSNTHIDSSNILPGKSFMLKTAQPTSATDSHGTITFDPEFKFAGGSAPTATATSGSEDIYTFVAFDSTNVYSTQLADLK